VSRFEGTREAIAQQEGQAMNMSKHETATAVEVGTVLIRTGTPIPENLVIKTEAFMPGWCIVREQQSAALDHAERASGWNLFFMAGEIRAGAYGSNNPTMTAKALRRILRSGDTTNSSYNCMEITGLVRKPSFGLPRTCISAHRRHLQRSGMLQR
jgi:hypothetical protein